MNNKKDLDILNRDEFIDNIIRLIDDCARKKESISFAINGKWGSGKTWVIEKIRSKLTDIQSEETAKDRYFIIHYNCWKYDYYSEPLVAIVSSIIDSLDETKFIPEVTKSKIKGILSTIGKSVLSVGERIIENKTGIDVSQIADGVSNIRKEAKESETELHSSDEFFSFKKTLTKLRQELTDLSNEYTLIFIVDELDRCLPKYAINVLERIHHLTEGIDNCQLLLSVDKDQFDNTIKTIYGDKVNINGYLNKFIDFSITLPIGEENEENIKEYYADYFSEFSPNCGLFGGEPYDRFFFELFKYTDIRQQKKIIEKAKLAHFMMPQEKKQKDITFLYFEIVLSLFSTVKKNLKEEFARNVKMFDEIIDRSNESERELWIICPDWAKQKCISKDTLVQLFLNRTIWVEFYIMIFYLYETNLMQYRHIGQQYDSSLKFRFDYAREFCNILSLLE